MRGIRTKIICAGANNPVTIEADRYLFSMGILYLPDFATNCGGVLGNAMEFAGITEDDLVRLLRDSVAVKYAKLWKIACTLGKTPREVAMDIAEENFQRLQKENEIHRGRSWLQTLLIDFYRRGLFPASLVRLYAQRYFRNMLMRDSHLYEVRLNNIE